MIALKVEGVTARIASILDRQLPRNGTALYSLYLEFAALSIGALILLGLPLYSVFCLVFGQVKIVGFLILIINAASFYYLGGKNVRYS